MKERLGMRTCVRAVLAQSDAQGWVRDTAGGQHWKLSPMPKTFKPGYEHVDYEIREIDLKEGTVTSTIHQDQHRIGDFEPWEQKLRELGFVWKQPYWTKRLHLPIRPGGEENDRTIYMWTYRSLPDRVDQMFAPVGRICDQPNAENIGLELERAMRTDRERGLASTQYLCRPEWDAIPSDKRINMQAWLTQVNLVADQGRSGERHSGAGWSRSNRRFGVPLQRVSVTTFHD